MNTLQIALPHMPIVKPPHVQLLTDVARECDEPIPSLATVMEYLTEGLEGANTRREGWKAVNALHTIFPRHAETIAEKWLDAHMDSILQALVDDIDAALYEPYGSPLEVSACQSYIERHHMPQWCFGMLMDLYSYHS